MFIEIKSEQQVKEMVELASRRGSVRLIVEGELEDEPSSAECSEAMANRRVTGGEHHERCREYTNEDEDLADFFRLRDKAQDVATSRWAKQLAHEGRQKIMRASP